jgi:hypothetical protein
MAVRAEHDKDQCQLVLHVSCKDLSSAGEIENTFNDLDAALNKIEENLSDDLDYDFFLIDLEAKGAPRPLRGFDPYEGGEIAYPLGPRNPWTVFCPAFWKKASADPRLRQRVKDWLVRLEKTLQLAETHQRSTDSLWEHDETQFGEPVASYMALLDVEFVPYYTRLLRLWDMGHEVHTGGFIDDIVTKYGIRTETEELILCYTEQHGGVDDLGLLELLEKSKRR